MPASATLPRNGFNSIYQNLERHPKEEDAESQAQISTLPRGGLRKMNSNYQNVAKDPKAESQAQIRASSTLPRSGLRRMNSNYQNVVKNQNVAKHPKEEDVESQAQIRDPERNAEVDEKHRRRLYSVKSLGDDQTQVRELTNIHQVKESAIQSTGSKEVDEIRKLQEEAQAQIRELTNALHIKEGIIQSTEAKVEEEKRRSSQLRRELATIKSAEREEFSQLQREAQAQIRELMVAIQFKEHTIQDKEDELQAKELEIRRKSEQIAELQQRVNEDGKNIILTQSNMNIPRAQIESISKKEIGHGAWGVVYSGSFQWQPVAIKYAHRDLLHVTTIDMLKREVMIMANIQHPNLVRFVGAVFDEAVERGRDMPIIVSELMDMNLRTAYRKKNLSSSLISIFCDVAYALHYLHQHSQSIIHRDVSAPNVLLKSLRSGGYQAKVSDFGSANLVKQSTTAGAGAIVYCAPEMFPNQDITAPPQPQTTKVDVFSYGILLLEVIVREIPNPATRYTMLQQVKDKNQQELIIQCTKPLPNDRPAMADILNRLHKIH